MKCRYKTNKKLTAVNETKHSVTTSEGKIIHKKLASNPIKFQLSKKTRRTARTNQQMPSMRKVQSKGVLRHPQKSLQNPQQPQEPCCRYTLPTMPQKRSMYGDIITDNIETDASESQVTTQAEEMEPGEEQPSVIGEPQTTEETAHDREQSTTPMRATVTAEGAPEKETVGREKSKTELNSQNEKIIE